MKQIQSILLLFFITVLTACSTVEPSDISECAQNNYGNPNFCDGLVSGDQIPSCDSCNTCFCGKAPDGILYPGCTEMGCEL